MWMEGRGRTGWLDTASDVHNDGLGPLRSSSEYIFLHASPSHPPKGGPTSYLPQTNRNLMPLCLPIIRESPAPTACNSHLTYGSPPPSPCPSSSALSPPTSPNPGASLFRSHSNVSQAPSARSARSAQSAEAGASGRRTGDDDREKQRRRGLVAVLGEYFARGTYSVVYDRSEEDGKRRR